MKSGTAAVRNRSDPSLIQWVQQCYSATLLLQHFKELLQKLTVTERHIHRDGLESILNITSRQPTPPTPPTPCHFYHINTWFEVHFRQTKKKNPKHLFFFYLPPLLPNQVDSLGFICSGLETMTCADSQIVRLYWVPTTRTLEYKPLFSLQR